ncbi:MAG: glycosyltransferase family 4 protein [Chitinophagales bacterium]
MHITIVTPGFAANEADTTCIPYLQDYVRSLSRAIGGEHIDIVALHYPYTKTPYQWHHISVHPMNGQNIKWPRKYFFLSRVTQQIKKVSMQNNTILHAFWLNDACLTALPVARKRQIPMLTTAMGQDVLSKNIFLSVLPVSKMHIAVFNAHMRKEFISHHPCDNMHIIPLAVDVPAFQPVERDIDILFAGSFTKGKRPALFVQACIDIMRAYPGIKCVMAGDGPLLDQTQKAIDAQGNHILCTGKVERSVLLQLMQRSKVLMHTSEYEGSATVIEEAVSCGMHVFCFDVGRNENQNIHICNTLFEMTTAVSQFLQKSADHTPRPSARLEETTQMYIDLYQHILAIQKGNL